MRVVVSALTILNSVRLASLPSSSSSIPPKVCPVPVCKFQKCLPGSSRLFRNINHQTVIISNKAKPSKKAKVPFLKDSSSSVDKPLLLFPQVGRVKAVRLRFVAVRLFQESSRSSMGSPLHSKMDRGLFLYVSAHAASSIE
ncbi:hypothetical protein B0J13DRAFT_39283 [Dactylonectria estremocensis]|uniref:Uncharacterized protein n=1 Tax=Dactylonectria estremocensis TaxID=1079267 RepID=A0A9P9FKY8_9HYPO|nr:hypothetical protein B0J13DRAFT_39283 [Dactylonectria estremocensis]